MENKSLVLLESALSGRGEDMWPPNATLDQAQPGKIKSGSGRSSLHTGLGPLPGHLPVQGELSSMASEPRLPPGVVVLAAEWDPQLTPTVRVPDVDPLFFAPTKLEMVLPKHVPDAR